VDLVDRMNSEQSEINLKSQSDLQMTQFDSLLDKDESNGPSKLLKGNDAAGPRANQPSLATVNIADEKSFTSG